MSVFDSQQFRSILKHVLQEPADGLRQQVLRDWLMDHDCEQPVADEAILQRPLSQWDIWSFGSGRGIGSGIGIGRGIGSGSVTFYEVKIMEPGKAYLLHCGDWHTFVGRVVKQVGRPLTCSAPPPRSVRRTTVTAGTTWPLATRGCARTHSTFTSRRIWCCRCPLPVASGSVRHPRKQGCEIVEVQS